MSGKLSLRLRGRGRVIDGGSVSDPVIDLSSLDSYSIKRDENQDRTFKVTGYVAVLHRGGYFLLTPEEFRGVEQTLILGQKYKPKPKGPKLGLDSDPDM